MKRAFKLLIKNNCDVITYVISCATGSRAIFERFLSDVSEKCTKALTETSLQLFVILFAGNVSFVFHDDTECFFKNSFR